jgi:CBS domain-containing protein
MYPEMGEVIRLQKALTLAAASTVQEACRRMHGRKVGAVLVTNGKAGLIGIFTGRDVVRLLARGRDPTTTVLKEVMTRNPATMPPSATAVDALRIMRDGGFRHVPVVEAGVLYGIVSRGDIRGLEHDRLDETTGLWERMR